MTLQQGPHTMYLLIVLHQSVCIQIGCAQHVSLMESIEVDRGLKFHKGKAKVSLDSPKVIRELGGGVHTHT